MSAVCQCRVGIPPSTLERLKSRGEADLRHLSFTCLTFLRNRARGVASFPFLEYPLSVGDDGGDASDEGQTRDHDEGYRPAVHPEGEVETVCP